MASRRHGAASSRSAVVCCARACLAILDLENRRSVEPLQHSGETRQREGPEAARTSPITAHSVGFSAADAVVMMRTDPGGRIRAPAARGRARSGDVRRRCCSTSRSRPSTTSSRTACARRSSRWRWSTCRRCQQLDLEYRFPAYTGLAPRKSEGGRRRGDPRHRRLLHVAPTMATPGGRIMLNDGGVSCADDAGRRHADRQLQDRPGRGSTRSS